MKIFLLLSFFCFFLPGVKAMETDSLPVHPKEVESVDAILKSLYDVISGPAGQKRDWNRMRSLFDSQARFIPTGIRPDGIGVRKVMTLEEYIQSSGPYLEKEGFFETEISRKTDQFGSLVQVFSTYESRHTIADPKPFMRGINSIQLWNDGKRWWILSIFWQQETKEVPIPDKYLD